MSLLDDNAFPHKCTIQRRRSRSRGGTTDVSDLGGRKNESAVEQTGVECWKQPASVREINEFEKREMSIDTKVYFKSDPNVTARHQILITEDQGTTISNPDILDVIASDPDSSAGLGVVYKVMCNLNTGEDR